jgi:transcription elongation GreA/GreB family factor
MRLRNRRTSFICPRPRNNLNKRAVIKKIIAKLAGELEIYFRAAQFSRAEATHESNKPENKYDTRGLEASYLARGQSKQAAELETAIREFEKLDARKFGDDETIAIGALVELETGGEKLFYFIGPRAGGTEILHDQKEILVITPQSPLGEQLTGKKCGDELVLNFGGRKQSAKIVSVE